MPPPYCVLNIEDDPNMSRLIRLVLKDMPIDLHQAHNGKTALDIVDQFKPDLMIVDVSLPDMHGWDVLDKMKGKGIDPEKIPVIMLTSHTDATHRVIAKLKSVSAYMNKPFAPAELQEKVKQLLKI
jgi:DNA-binding response OmpR family regulator